MYINYIISYQFVYNRYCIMQRRRSLRKIKTPANSPSLKTKVVRSRIGEPRDDVTISRRIKSTKTRIEPTKMPRNKTRTLGMPNIKFGKVDPVFRGETIYIVGGGPSLKSFDFDTLKLKKTIAINKAFYSVPFASVLYWTDSRVYNWYQNDIDNFNGLKFTIGRNRNYNDSVTVLRKGNKFGLEENSDAIAHGNNSGYAAINLAYHLGASKIVLLGFDMVTNDHESHFHDGYPTRKTKNSTYQIQFIPAFPHIASALKNKKIKVYNTNPKSLLDCFPKITLDQGLKL